jgi:hypothetical protein
VQPQLPLRESVICRNVNNDWRTRWRTRWRAIVYANIAPSSPLAVPPDQPNQGHEQLQKNNPPCFPYSVLMREQHRSAKVLQH